MVSRRVFVVKYAGDNRYDDAVGMMMVVVMYDLVMMLVLLMKDLRNIDNVVYNYDVIGIDEG